MTVIQIYSCYNYLNKVLRHQNVVPCPLLEYTMYFSVHGNSVLALALILLSFHTPVCVQSQWTLSYN